MSDQNFSTDSIKDAIAHHMEVARNGNADDCREAYSGTVKRVGIYCNEASFRKFRWYIDEPASVGGSDAGANPAEMTLAALAASIEVTIEVYAAHLGIPLSMIEINVAGDLDMRGFFGTDDSIRSGFSGIDLQISIRSTAPESDIARLVKIAERCCPILDALKHGSEIRLSVNQEKS